MRKEIRTFVYGCKAPIENAGVVSSQVARAHRYRNVLTEIGRLEQQARTARCFFQEPKSEEVGETVTRLVREARHVNGLYWGTYNNVERAFRQALGTSRKELRFCRWDETGSLAVQIQGAPLPVAKLLAGTDGRARLGGSGKHRLLYLRVASDGLAPVWGVFPIVYHRDLPNDAAIAGVKVVLRRVARQLKWSAQFILEAPRSAFALPSPTEGTVALDVGWRRLGEEVRVATWVDDSGRSGELRLPARMLQRDKKVADLRSIRDKLFNEARNGLLEARRAGDWPEWLLEETTHTHAWKSPERLHTLALKWRHNRFAGDAALYDALEAWRKQNRHLYEWECHQRENALRNRRELYRIFARRLAGYAKVVVEKLDLRDFAELPGKEDKESPLVTSSRGRRFDAALSELFGACADAVSRAGGVWQEVEPAMTTQTCADCEKEERFDAAKEVAHMCSSCGVTWDQDVNAARNLLLRAATWEAPAEGRSRMKVAVAKGESALANRRRAGKAKKKGECSRTVC